MQDHLIKICSIDASYNCCGKVLGSPKELVIVMKLRCSNNNTVVFQPNELGLDLS